MDASSRLSSGAHFLRSNGRSVVPVGTHYVPASGPDWPWRVGADDFDAAFAAMAAEGLNAVRIDLLWGAIEPELGRFDEEHLAVLDAIVGSARQHGLWLHPTFFIGGEVGDAYWDTPWAQGRNPHADPELLTAQAAHVAALGRRWSNRDEVMAWDLTDEPPFWIHPDTTDEQARLWTRTLCAALREVDPSHLITVGTASQDVGWGPFRADVIVDQLDFVCVHPYPIFSPDNYPEPIVGRRTTHAHAFETALARGAGRPVMVHEYGASSTQYSPERIATHDRLGTWAAFGRGAIGFFSWCWGDADPAAYARAPYVRGPHETQFGMHTYDGTPRPRAAELSALASTLSALDLDAIASNGPVARAATLVPHEYVRPYDPAAFGLTDAPAGLYLPAEKHWHPDRSVTPLVQTWLSAFVLSSQAGMAIDFVREQLDATLPDPATTPLLLCPAPLTTCIDTLVGLRPTQWATALNYARAGGTVYLSCSVATAIPGLDELAGVRIVDRAPWSKTRVRFTHEFGGVKAGSLLTLPKAHDGVNRGVLFELRDATAIAVDEAGHPVITVARRGEGWVVACAHPVESLLGGRPDDPFETSGAWQLYDVLASLSGATLPARLLHRDVTNGVLTGQAGGLLVLTNHTPDAAHGGVVLPEEARFPRLFEPGTPPNAGIPLTDAELTVPGHGVRLITWSC